MDTAKIVVDRDENERIRSRVQLGTFIHGRLKQDRTNLTGVQMYEDQTRGSKRKQKMVAETCNMVYEGRNFDEHSNDSFQSTYLGAFCPKTGKIEVFEVDMFSFRPYLPELMEDQTDKTDAAKPKEDLTIAEQQELLTSAFGSKKAKLVTEARKKTRVAEESLKTVLKSTIADGQAAAIETQQKLEQLMNSEDTQLFYLPECNREAKKAEDIFSLSSIISEQEMTDMTTPAQELFDCNAQKLAKWRKEEKYPIMVLNHLENLPSTEDSRWQKCKCLMYLSYMITFIKMSTSMVTSRHEIFPAEWPASVKTRLLAKFTGPPPIDMSMSSQSKYKRSYSKKYQERLLSFILILGLMLDKYTLKCQDVIKDTNIGFRRLMDLARLIGLKILKTKNIELATIHMEAPLKFGSLARARPKKR